MKKTRLSRLLVLMLIVAIACAQPALAVYNPADNGPESDVPIYSAYGAHQGLDADTQNVDISDSFTDEDAQAYITKGAYILSNKPTTDKTYESGVYYETTDFAFGDGIYVIIQDEDSVNKHYTLIKSAQDLQVGEPFIYRDGDIGGRLLDDKYTSTRMASNFQNGEYSYVSYDGGGGKLAEQTAEKDENGIPLDSQAQGFTYLYVVSETPADYYQRLANEKAGYETPAQAEDRQYMPANNSHLDADAVAYNYNNWTNLTEDDPVDYNDRIIRVGNTEGNSNSRLYSYSGQNVIVAKYCITFTPSVAQLTWADSTAFNAEADYDAVEGEITIQAGESQTLYFHTQFHNCWGRDGYTNGDITYVIGDENIISYVGKSDEEGVENYVLTALEPGTTTLTATLEDLPGKYSGGTSVTLTVTVK